MTMIPKKIIEVVPCNPEWAVQEVTNLNFGHTDPIMTLPYGRVVQINADKKKIGILENAVA